MLATVKLKEKKYFNIYVNVNNANTHTHALA